MPQRIRIVARTVTVWIALATAAAGMSGCFVDGRCTRHDDCAAGEFCSEGSCLARQCTLDLDCPAAHRCEGFRCVRHGTPAPDFALTDLNPTSPTFGEEIRLASYRGRVLLIYFANAT